MQSKLQELTDKLYKEGLSKGKAEGEQIVAEAKKEADEIISKAMAEARKISEKAEKDAADLKSKAESDIRMASSQTLSATKKDIESLLVNRITEKKIAESLEDTAFIKEMIKTVAEKFSAQESADLNVILPDSMKKDLEPWCASELAKVLKAGVKAEFTKKIQGGFTIGPADGSYFVSLSEDTFKELFGEYIRPVTRKILFGE